MKTIIHKALLVFFFNTLVFGQSGWVWLNPLPQGNFLHDLQFVNSSIAYCISYINVLKSTDAGNTWQMKWINTNQYLVSLYFVDVNNGYLLCDSGLVLRTSNSGADWFPIYNFNIPNFNKICFVNTNTGIALKFNLRGYYGTLLYRTTNSGLQWNTVIDDTNYTMKDFSFVGQNTGLCAANNTGYYYSWLKFFKTTNSGLTWDSIPANLYNDVQGCLFLNSSTGYVFGSGAFNRAILKTTNGGTNWSGVFGSPVSDLEFINSSVGYGLWDYTGIIKTTNGGSNWVYVGRVEGIGDPNNGGEISFLSENYGVFVGSGIAKSTNGALNWSAVSGIHTGWIWDVDFADANIGYAGGGPLLKTTNSGSNWFVLPADNGLVGTSPIEFVNAQTGFSTCYYNSNIELIKTTNGGYNWNILNYGLPGQLNEIQFLNENTGYILGKYSVTYKTTNGGINWSLISGYGYGYQECLYFYNENLGFIGRRQGSSGQGVICRTTNGGISWDSTLINAEYPIDFHFVNPNTGYASIYDGYSDPIYKTTNGGTNWVQVFSGGPNYINSIQFVNESTGYGVMAGGYFLRTSNAGLSWTLHRTITNNFLADLYFFDANTGIVVGDNSTILKTTTGGLPIGLEPISSEVPESYILHQNYPNPFNPVTRIKIQVAGNTTVKLTICDVIGREIAVLVNEQLKPGIYEVSWDGTNYPSGVYFYRLTTSDFTQTRKMVLLK